MREYFHQPLKLKYPSPGCKGAVCQFESGKETSEAPPMSWRSRMRNPSYTHPEMALALELNSQHIRFEWQAPIPINHPTNPKIQCFIVDFRFHNLIVEVDGPHHLKREGKDQLRDQLLGKEGYQILRLPAELCLKKPDEAVDHVERCLKEAAGREHRQRPIPQD